MKYDGKYVLLTNTALSALVYKALWLVQRSFRETKSTLEIQPVYLSREDHDQGHVDICFMSFCLQTAFRKATCDLKEIESQSFVTLLLSLKELRMVKLTAGGKSFRERMELDKIAKAIFRAGGLLPDRKPPRHRVSLLNTEKCSAKIFEVYFYPFAYNMLQEVL